MLPVRAARRPRAQGAASSPRAPNPTQLPQNPTHVPRNPAPSRPPLPPPPRALPLRCTTRGACDHRPEGLLRLRALQQLLGGQAAAAAAAGQPIDYTLSSEVRGGSADGGCGGEGPQAGPIAAAGSQGRWLG